MVGCSVCIIHIPGRLRANAASVQKLNIPFQGKPIVGSEPRAMPVTDIAGCVNDKKNHFLRLFIKAMR